MWTNLTAEGTEVLGTGIYQCLTAWTALQLAIHNGWGGQTSNLKFQQLHSEILTFFTRSKEQRYIDELEDLLDQFMLNSFNTEIEDGSIFEVSEQLMTIHEECTLGNFENVKRLIASTAGSAQSVHKSVELPSPEDEMGDPTDNSGLGTSQADGDDMDMDLENSSPPSSNASKPTPKPVQSRLTEEEVADGWQEAPARSRRRNKN